MKILNITSISLASIVFAGCIGQSNDIDPAICDHHPGEYNCPEADSSASTDSSASVVESSSSDAPMSSSSSSSVVSSSSAIVVSSSSEAPSSVASSSTPMTPINELSFSAELNEDQSIQTDSIENLGSALIGLIDQDAFDAFYLNLVAQGLDEAAIAKAVSALNPVGAAIGANFVKALSGQDLLPAPEGINLISAIVPIGFAGTEYAYTVNQTIDGVDVALDLALRFETMGPSLNAFTDGTSGYNVFLSGVQVVVNELKLTTSEVVIELDTAEPLLTSGGQLIAKIGLTEDQSNITSVELFGQAIELNLKGSVINGIIGVEANGTGTIGVLSADLDMVSGSTTIEVTEPNVEVNMQGIDTEG